MLITNERILTSSRKPIYAFEALIPIQSAKMWRCIRELTMALLTGLWFPSISRVNLVLSRVPRVVYRAVCARCPWPRGRVCSRP